MPHEADETAWGDPQDQGGETTIQGIAALLTEGGRIDAETYRWCKDDLTASIYAWPRLDGPTDGSMSKMTAWKIVQKLYLRQEFNDRAEARRIEKEGKLYVPKKPGPSRFTTQYAVEWGKRQGWRMKDRERYDARTKRHHDLMMGVDAMFHAPGRGIVGVQAAGKGERAAHYRAFEERGGVETARDMRIEVLYAVFVREDRDPIQLETWA